MAVQEMSTTVKNSSGATLVFGFLPPHSRSLTNGSTYTLFGHLQTRMLCGGGRLNERKRKAFESALTAGTLEVMSTPALILQDKAPIAALANPTVATTAANSSGGSLAVGYYKFAYTFVNAWGETTIGTSTSTSTQATGSNLQITATVPAASGVSGATGVNVYCTAVAATSGAVDVTTFRKVAQVTGSTTTYLLTTLPAIGAGNPQPPATNTTLGPTSIVVSSSAGVLGEVDASYGRIF